MDPPLLERCRGFLEQSFILAFAAGALVFVILFGGAVSAVGPALFYAAVCFLIALTLTFVVSCLADDDVYARLVAWAQFPNPPVKPPASVEVATTKQPGRL
jgi:hypothetical protein